jgi:hypothetical protein
MADGTLAQRILERLGILTSTEPVEHGWHASGRDWPAEDSGPTIDEVIESLIGIEGSAEAASASLTHAGAAPL